MPVVVKTVVVGPILVGRGEFTTHFRLPISVGIESDAHWGYGLLAHGHMGWSWPLKW